ncbi:GTPase RhebL1 [Balamuthia mandrillaris]
MAAASQTKRTTRRINAFPPPGEGVSMTQLTTDFHESLKKMCSEADRTPIGEGIPAQGEKVIVVGDQSVGKTSLIRRFCEGDFANKYKATVGVDFVYQKYKILNQDFTLHIWDTAGQEQFRCISRSYFRGAAATILCFDLSRPSSFENCSLWVNEVLQEVELGHKIFLAGLKGDLKHAVDHSTVKRWATEIGAEYWEVSAKEDHNVERLFDRVAVALFEQSMIVFQQKAKAKANSSNDSPFRAKENTQNKSAEGSGYCCS